MSAMTGTQTYRDRIGVRGAGASFSPQMLPAEAFRMRVAQWFFAATECRIEIALTKDDPDRKRGYLSSLIGWGEWAQMIIAENHIDLSPIGVTTKDLEAETRILRDTYRSAFENCLSESEAEAVLKEVFG